MIIEWNILNGCFKIVQHQFETKENFKCEQKHSSHFLSEKNLILLLILTPHILMNIEFSEFGQLSICYRLKCLKVKFSNLSRFTSIITPDSDGNKDLVIKGMP